MPDDIIIVSNTTREVVEVTAENPTTDIIEITTGPPGPAGPTGPIGLTGPQGPSGGLYFSHIQSSPAADWVINHGLNQKTNITVVVNGEAVEADVTYNSLNQVTIHFSSPQLGEAIFS